MLIRLSKMKQRKKFIGRKIGLDGIITIHDGCMIETTCNDARNSTEKCLVFYTPNFLLEHFIATVKIVLESEDNQIYQKPKVSWSSTVATRMCCSKQTH